MAGTCPEVYTPFMNRGHQVITGIGTSAGGIDALTRLFSRLPADAGIAYVVVQHLSPGHESLLHELLERASELRVVQAADGQPLEPDHAYVCPPGVYVEIDGGTLHLTPTAETERAPVHPIDRFFRSLARSAGHDAIGVVLSGNATDGAQGLREVKEAGGFAIAQQPETAA